MKFTMSALGRVFQLRWFKTPQLPIKGYTSRCEDGQHVLFLDYDMVSPNIVKQDLERLKPHLSHAAIFCTDKKEDELGTYGNFHVICMDKFLYTEVYELMKLTHADALHRSLAKHTRYRAWVLRFTNKGSRSPPHFENFYSYGAPHTRLHSRAHYKLLCLLSQEFSRKTKGYEWIFDNSTHATITHYNTLVEQKNG